MRRLTEAVVSQNRSAAKRKTFVSSRRSSFFDQEATESALIESDLKLVQAAKSLETLEAEHKDLKAKVGNVVTDVRMSATTLRKVI